MLGANPATRALLMPEQLSSLEMRAVERRLGWLPATFNVGAAQIQCVGALFRDDLPTFVREFQPIVSALRALHEWRSRPATCFNKVADRVCGLKIDDIRES